MLTEGPLFAGCSGSASWLSCHLLPKAFRRWIQVKVRLHRNPSHLKLERQLRDEKQEEEENVDNASTTEWVPREGTLWL